MKIQNSIVMAVILSAGMVACSSDDDVVKQPEETAHVSVRMTDAPGDYDEVLIEVEDVKIKSQPSEGGEGAWESLGNIQAGVYDLLTLTGGVTELLGESEIPAGKLDQIRLVLGDNNSIVVDGTSYTLKTPSAQESGLKLAVNEVLEAGKNYDFLLDFDVSKSIVETGNGNYLLKPVIRVSLQEETGVIMGSVHPTNIPVLVEATNGSVNISAFTDAEGKFQLFGIPEGIYQVTLTPGEESGLLPQTINDVSVETGESTDLEVIFLE